MAFIIKRVLQHFYINIMRNNNLRQPPVPQLTRHTSQTSNEIQQLRAQLKSLRHIGQQKQSALLQFNTKLRNEGLRNQKLKNQVTQVDERTNEFVKNQVAYLFNKYKDNKASPLFYNQNGLSPFELLKIGQTKYEQNQNHICMVCYVDLQKGARVMKLPCGHILHKQCAIQQLLYSKQCPACSIDIK